MNDDFLKKFIPTMTSDDKEALSMAANFTRPNNRKDFSLDIRTSLETVLSNKFDAVADDFIKSSNQAFAEVLNGLENLGLKVNPMATFLHNQVLHNFFNRHYLGDLLKQNSDKEPVFIAFMENFEWATTDESETDFYAEYEVDIVLMTQEDAYPVSSNMIVLSECKLKADEYDIEPDEED